MPVYTYRRQDGTTFDYRQNFSDAPLAACPTTGQSVTRIVQSAGIIFKGSGFYVTDNKGASKSAVTTPANGTAETTAKSDTPAEAKSETKTETKASAEPAAD
jgi:putative FmdB family regulatory protein